MRVALLIIATNRYIEFVPPLVESARQFFLPGHQVDYVVLTNRDAPPGTLKIDHGHEPWPMPTLKRYHAFWRERERLSKYDYLFYSDADMRFVDRVGDEIFGDLVAVEHPGYRHRRRAEFTFETRPESAAYVGPDEGPIYYAGGFQGGRSANYLEAAREISARIDRDFSRGIVAVWHDESHWNRYLIDHPPAVTLDSSYCYAEGVHLEGLSPRLLALKKDHDAVRGIPPWKRFVERNWNRVAWRLRRLIRG